MRYVTREDLTLFGRQILASVTENLQAIANTIVENINRSQRTQEQPPEQTTSRRGIDRPVRSALPVRRSAETKANHVNIA